MRFLRLVYDMKVLSPYQLKHIYLSAMGIECKNFFIDNIFYLLGRHQNLETLVMSKPIIIKSTFVLVQNTIIEVKILQIPIS
jgi:hypothetical protein